METFSIYSNQTVSTYAERFMGMPNLTDNYQGYEEGDLSKHVDQLKDKQFLLVNFILISAILPLLLSSLNIMSHSHLLFIRFRYMEQLMIMYILCKVWFYQRLSQIVVLCLSNKYIQMRDTIYRAWGLIYIAQWRCSLMIASKNR